MPEYRRELPGDLLDALLRQHELANVAEFDRAHQNRIARAMERSLGEMTSEEQDSLWERLAPSYHKWTNRFAIMWDPNVSPMQWRAMFTLENLDALLFAGWLDEGSDLHRHFLQAIDLQNMLKLRKTYKGIEQELAFQQSLDLAQVYDQLAWAFADFVRGHPETRDWSFDQIGQFAKMYMENTMPTLAAIGLIDLPDDWRERLIHTGRTRGSASEDGDESSLLLASVREWAALILADLRPDGSDAHSAQGQQV
jgi:hypothetical protein